MKVYIDDNFFEKEEAKISVYDHGLLYGDGVFEGIRIYNGNIFKLNGHIDRLYKSAMSILLDIPLPKNELKAAIEETVKINEKKNCYIRLIITRGKGTLGINPMQCPKASIIIIVDDIQVYPEEYYDRGIAVITASTRRLPPDSIDPRIKSLNYLNNVMAKLEAIQANCQEAVMLNREGFVTECTADNIFIVRDDTIFTPISAYGALDGITKNTIIELAEKNGITAHDVPLTQYDLYNADECFLTGTGAEIMPIIQIDGRLISNGEPGPVTQKLLRSFRESL